MEYTIQELSKQISELTSEHGYNKTAIDILIKKVAKLETFKEEVLAKELKVVKIQDLAPEAVDIIKCPKCQEVLSKRTAKSDLTMLKRLYTLFCVKCGYERSILE